MTERVVETREESSDLEIEENWKDWRAESGGPTRGVSSRVEESTIWKRRARFGGEISRGKRCAWESFFSFGRSGEMEMGIMISISLHFLVSHFSWCIFCWQVRVKKSFDQKFTFYSTMYRPQPKQGCAFVFLGRSTSPTLHSFQPNRAQGSIGNL